MGPREGVEVGLAGSRSGPAEGAAWPLGSNPAELSLGLASGSVHLGSRDLVEAELSPLG